MLLFLLYGTLIAHIIKTNLARSSHGLFFILLKVQRGSENRCYEIARKISNYQTN